MAKETIATDAKATVANAFLQRRFLDSGKCTAENRLGASACQCVDAAARKAKSVAHLPHYGRFPPGDAGC
jgi:hypothetical protein